MSNIVEIKRTGVKGLIVARVSYTPTQSDDLKFALFIPECSLVTMGLSFKDRIPHLGCYAYLVREDEIREL